MTTITIISQIPHAKAIFRGFHLEMRAPSFLAPIEGGVTSVVSFGDGARIALTTDVITVCRAI
jgi:hypothetical protein